MFIMVYDDESDHWEQARSSWDHMTCEERLHLASWSAQISSQLKFDPFEFHTIVSIFEGHRPRFWYFTFVNCGATSITPVSFSIHALNVQQGSDAEFGMDQSGSLSLQVLFATLFALVCGLSFASTGTREARLEGPRTRSRPLAGFLKASAACSAAGCVCSALHWSRFSGDGTGILEMQVLGTLLGCLAKAILTFLQFFIAKGWALLFNHEEREVRQRYLILSGLGVTILVSVGCEIHEQYYRTESTQYYMYEDWPAFLILVINSCLLIAAWVMGCQTCRKERLRDVRLLYVFASAGCGIYFAAMPVIFIAASELEPWVVRKYIERAELAARFAATLVLLICLWPSKLDALISSRLKHGPEPELLSDHGEDMRDEVELRQGRSAAGVGGDDEDCE